MKYFEFNNHEYWAMVAAETLEKAYEVYQTEVGGDSIAEVMAEGKTEELKKDVAFGMYINAAIKYGGKHYFEAACDFHSSENRTLLIDASLT